MLAPSPEALGYELTMWVRRTGAAVSGAACAGPAAAVQRRTRASRWNRTRASRSVPGKGQSPDPHAGRREERVGDRRGDHRDRVLPEAAGRLRARQDVSLDDRRLVEPDHGVITAASDRHRGSLRG